MVENSHGRKFTYLEEVVWIYKLAENSQVGRKFTAYLQIRLSQIGIGSAAITLKLTEACVL